MPSLIADYLPLVVFIVLSALIGGALLVAPFIVAYKNPDPEKLSAYECGFNPFDDARMKFDARFYLVSLLFIIFDLEVAYLFPWAVAGAVHMDAPQCPYRIASESGKIHCGRRYPRRSDFI